MIKNEIKNIKETPKELKQFGLTIGSVLLLISAYLFYTDSDSYKWFSAAGVILILSGLLFPQVLRPLNKIWMILAILMGWIMTRVILSIIFFLVLTPIALVARITGKQFLALEKKNDSDSYWDKRKETSFNPEYYERQF